MRKSKKAPDFKTEAEERAFWQSHDSSEYLDWGKAQPVSLPNLKPSRHAKLHWTGELHRMRTNT